MLYSFGVMKLTSKYFFQSLISRIVFILLVFFILFWQWISCVKNK